MTERFKAGRKKVLLADWNFKKLDRKSKTALVSILFTCEAVSGRCFRDLHHKIKKVAKEKLIEQILEHVKIIKHMGADDGK